MDKKFYIAANWKMNGSLAFIDEYFTSLGSESKNSNEMIICPPDIYIQSVKEKAPSFVKVGAQNISHHDSGAYTGECSGQMIADQSAQYAIIGHSERREYHGESNDLIRLKLLKAIEHDIAPILCIGESIEQRDSGQTLDVINDQIRSVLDNEVLSANTNMLIAYEPIWSIGSGKIPTKNELAKTTLKIEFILIIESLISSTISSAINFSFIIVPLLN